MFRNYRDTVRTPKETEITYSELIKDAYNCDLCDKGGWLTPNDVEIHRKNAHTHIFHHYKNKHKARFCTVCMILLDSHEELIKHLKSQHLLSSPTAQRVERVIYICDKCTNIFFNKDVLAAHMLFAHLSNKTDRMNKHFTCPKCLKIFRLNTIWFHLQKHEIPSVSLCDICLTNFPNRSILSEHVKTHKRYLKCESCGYSSNKFLQYESHIDQHDHQRVPEREVSQLVLSSVFLKPRSNFIRYNMHNAIKGLNLPTFMQICTLCREICVSYEETVKHVLRNHMIDEAGKRRHMCVCGEEFEYKVVLKQHLLKMKGSHRAVDETEIPSVSSVCNDVNKMTEAPSVSESADINMDEAAPNPVSDMNCLHNPETHPDLNMVVEGTSKAELIIIKPGQATIDHLDENKMDVTNQNEEESTGAENNEVRFATLSPMHQGNPELTK